MGIRFEDPPKAPSSWADVAEELRAQPGRWAVVRDKSSGVKPNGFFTYASRIRRGTGPFAPAGSFEAVVRDVDGEMRVFARFVGGESQ